MIYTDYAEDTTVAAKNFVMPSENPAVTGIVPDGYMTGDEFKRRVKSELTELYAKHGLL